MDKELVEALGRTAYDHAKYMITKPEHTCVEGSDYFNAIYEGMFAELIVKACIGAIDNIEEMYLNSRLRTDDFTDKNRYAEGETACQMAKRKIELIFDCE